MWKLTSLTFSALPSIFLKCYYIWSENSIKYSWRAVYNQREFFWQRRIFILPTCFCWETVVCKYLTFLSSLCPLSRHLQQSKNVCAMRYSGYKSLVMSPSLGMFLGRKNSLQYLHPEKFSLNSGLRLRFSLFRGEAMPVTSSPVQVRVS